MRNIEKSNNLINVERSVLSNYKISSPSFINLNDKTIQAHLEKRKSLFQFKLNFPIKLFENSRILDLGSGTGEQDICYAKWGSKLTLVELNNLSIKETKGYFQNFKLEDSIEKIHHCSIFDFKPNGLYDIVISEGVFHHTENPEKCFDILVQNLKEDGFVVLQLAFDSSHLQRSLQRMILDCLTSGDYDQIIKVSPILFAETLSRASKYGGRSIKQIVHDFYTNPKHKGISILDIINWFKKKQIKYYSSYPSIGIENLINGVHKKGGAEIIEEFPHISAIANFYFLIACDEDEETILSFYNNCEEANTTLENLMENSGLNDYIYGQEININKLSISFLDYFKSVKELFKKRHARTTKKIETIESELRTLFENIMKRDTNLLGKQINNFEILFKGYNGVPSNYIIGCKSKDKTFGDDL